MNETLLHESFNSVSRKRAFKIHRIFRAYVSQLIYSFTIFKTDSNFFLELEQSAAFDINRELSCKGHPCPNCGQCRDWYFTGTAEELDWLRDEQNWEYEGKAWKRWCDGKFSLKFTPRNEKTCTGRRNFTFPFTVGKYDDGFYLGKGDFPHGPVGYARAVPLAENIPYDYEGYYSDFVLVRTTLIRKLKYNFTNIINR